MLILKLTSPDEQMKYSCGLPYQPFSLTNRLRNMGLVKVPSETVCFMNT